VVIGEGERTVREYRARKKAEPLLILSGRHESDDLDFMSRRRGKGGACSLQE